MEYSDFTIVNGRAHSNLEPLKIEFTITNTRMHLFRKMITVTLILIFLQAYLVYCDFCQLSFLSENAKPVLHGKIGGLKYHTCKCHCYS